MAIFNKKQPLIMLVLILISSISSVFAIETDLYRVVAISGLNLREKPKANARIISVIPFLTQIKVDLKNNATESINGKTGRWYQVTFQKNKGWVFSQFLCEEPASTRKLEARKNDFIFEQVIIERSMGDTFKRLLKSEPDFNMCSPQYREMIIYSKKMNDCKENKHKTIFVVMPEGNKGVLSFVFLYSDKQVKLIDWGTSIDQPGQNQNFMPELGLNPDECFDH